jgi:hypothetical protein
MHDAIHIFYCLPIHELCLAVSHSSFWILMKPQYIHRSKANNLQDGRMNVRCSETVVRGSAVSAAQVLGFGVRSTVVLLVPPLHSWRRIKSDLVSIVEPL